MDVARAVREAPFQGLTARGYVRFIAPRDERCFFAVRIQIMGVMTRKSGEVFIITSDRAAGDLPTKHAPKARSSGVYQVWTENGWSATVADAKTFTAMGVAEEYIRANYARVMA